MSKSLLTLSLLCLTIASAADDHDNHSHHHRHSNRVMTRKSWQGKNLKIMTFNIWVCGNFVNNGTAKIAKHIVKNGPDVVGIQEVKGASCMRDIFNHLRKLEPETWTMAYTGNANNAIFTKHTVIEESIHLVSAGIGATIELDKKHQINFYSMHLAYMDYGPYAATNKLVTKKEQIDNGEYYPAYSRYNNIKNLLNNENFTRALIHSKDTPLFVVGDFNSPSHLDWTEKTRHVHYDWVYEWPATAALQNGTGIVDSFRELHPDPLAEPGITWSTVNKSAQGWRYSIPEPQDRIDFIFYKSPHLRTIRSGPVAGKFKIYPASVKNNDWPSDHYAFVSEFKGEES